MANYQLDAAADLLWGEVEQRLGPSRTTNFPLARIVVLLEAQLAAQTPLVTLPFQQVPPHKDTYVGDPVTSQPPTTSLDSTGVQTDLKSGDVGKSAPEMPF